MQQYLVASLQPGAYDLVVEAPAYSAETRSIVMDADGASQSLAVGLTPSQVTVVTPNLFGLAVNVAMQQATTAGLVVAAGCSDVTRPPATAPRFAAAPRTRDYRPSAATNAWSAGAHRGQSAPLAACPKSLSIST